MFISLSSNTLVQETESCNFVTVGSVNPDLEELFNEGGSLILHKIQLGDSEWVNNLHQQLSVISMKLEISCKFNLDLIFSCKFNLDIIFS